MLKFGFITMEYEKISMSKAIKMLAQGKSVYYIEEPNNLIALVANADSCISKHTLQEIAQMFCKKQFYKRSK